MRPPLQTTRKPPLQRLLRQTWEALAPGLLLVSLLALVAQVPRWTA